MSSAGALVELKAPCLTDIVLVYVVDYIYTGALPNSIDQQERSALLAAASYLQMDGLLEALQTKVKSADKASSSTAWCENQPCKLVNSTEAMCVDDMCQQLSSTCSVKSSDRDNQHREDVSVCCGCERCSCCENADLNVSSVITGECRQVHSQTPRNLIQSISSTAAWHRASGEDNEFWEDQFHSADSWQRSRDELPWKAENGKSLYVLPGEEEGETSEEDGKLPQGARETRDSKDVQRKRKDKDEDRQRGQRPLSTLQPGENSPLLPTLFDERSSSTTSHPCSGAVPVIRHSSSVGVNLSLSSLHYPVTQSTVCCSKALPSGSTDDDRNAEGMKNKLNNQLKAENRDVNKQGERCCDTEALAQTAQEDALYKPNKQDYSCCSRGNDRYWDRFDITDHHINHCDSFQNDSQHFRTDSMAPNKEKDQQLQCSNCHVLTATTTENLSSHSPCAQSVVQSPLHSGTGSFSHYEKFGPERESIKRLSDSHRPPADSDEQHSQCHRFGDFNEYAELSRGEKSFSSNICVQLADTDVDATADAGSVEESLEHENVSEQSSNFNKRSDVDTGFVAHSYNGHIHYHCLSQVDPRLYPQQSFYPHPKPSSQSGDEQEAGLIPCQAPSPLRQPLASSQQVVLLDISTKSPELLVSCTSDKTGPWLAFTHKDTSRKGLENIAGRGTEGQNTAAGSSNSENPPPTLTICSSSGVPDYVEASSPPTLSVCMPSAVPVSVPTNASEQLSAPLHHPFQCSMCERSFSQRGSLNRHVRSHLGIRPFPCPRCPMTFSRQYRVTEHMRVHQRFVPECDFPKPSAPPI